DHMPANDRLISGVTTPVGIDSRPWSAPESSATPLSATVGTPAAIGCVQLEACGCSWLFPRYDVVRAPTAAHEEYPRQTPFCDLSRPGASLSAGTPVR